PMTISPFARWLISTYEWRPAILIIGVAAWVLLVPAALLVMRPPAETADTGTEFAADGARPQLSKVFRSPHSSPCGRSARNVLRSKLRRSGQE
ncbi:hypothetical protein ACC846_37770, partial [Rhizobium ruizarguesonis]